ncbi:MAG: tRNA (adenosine(37)-N6)-threonylcarbamoyltransferase complex dimerization subunit type 1 TsaB [Desulfobulbaceae bacterium]|nr:tRNA (adenosine(37)-N6)-threonylcarbamoyltransferase complex dimerization subunit type 1 TsaB [Desulfobulbaceae bacterium]
MDGLLILAIETATGCGSVSLSREGLEGFHLLAECTTQPDITHSRRLLGSVEWLMQGAGVTWNDLDGVAVSTGPGSFTGLRIGMAAAKAISMATASSLIGIPTLDALACSAGARKRLLCCLLDARKQQVYAAFYRTAANGLPVRLRDPSAVSPQNLLQGIEEPVLLVGPGARVYRDCIDDCQQTEILQDYLGLPRAMYIGLLAAEKLKKGDVLDPLTAAPMYVRAPEAEVNLKRKQLLQT